MGFFTVTPKSELDNPDQTTNSHRIEQHLVAVTRESINRPIEGITGLTAQDPHDYVRELAGEKAPTTARNLIATMLNIQHGELLWTTADMPRALAAHINDTVLAKPLLDTFIEASDTTTDGVAIITALNCNDLRHLRDSLALSEHSATHTGDAADLVSRYVHTLTAALQTYDPINTAVLYCCVVEQSK